MGLQRRRLCLGRALKRIDRDKYYLATKVGRYGDKEFDFSAKRVTASVDESLARLGVDVIDLIQCHDIEFGSIDQIVDETLPALRKLKEAGKVRFVGITGLPLKVFRSVIDRAPVDTILSYCRYALNDTSLEGIIPYLEQKGVGIINASPFSMRLLTNGAPPDWHPAPLEIRAACAKAAEHCRSRGSDIAQLAVQFAVANPLIATTLVGSSRSASLIKNVEWASHAPDETLLAEVMAILAPIKNKTWPSGLPENND